LVLHEFSLETNRAIKIPAYLISIGLGLAKKYPHIYDRSEAYPHMKYESLNKTRQN